MSPVVMVEGTVAIGAKAAKPECDVWAVDGDGCFQMTAQELVTATVEGLPIKVALLNNSYLGMVRQWQEMFYGKEYAGSCLHPRDVEPGDWTVIFEPQAVADLLDVWREG